MKRSKIVHDEENKENAFYLPPPVSIRVRRGVRPSIDLRDTELYFSLSLSQLVRSFSEQQPNVNEEHIKASVELGNDRERSLPSVLHTLLIQVPIAVWSVIEVELISCPDVPVENMRISPVSVLKL